MGLVKQSSGSLNSPMRTLTISKKSFHFRDFAPFFRNPIQIRISKASKQRIRASHKTLQNALSTGETIYGVNTGFGKLSQISIDPNQLEKLQINLVRSHAAGVGKPISDGLVRSIIFLKLLTYAKGHSGIRFSLAEQLIYFLNHDILPVIPEKGSVGASGDLAPLGHMALAIIGEGEVSVNKRVIKTVTALKKAGLKSYKLGPKEGLSLINGTQFSTSIAIQAMLQAECLAQSADLIGAISVEGSLSSRNVFKSSIHAIKNHPGQIQSAKNVWKILKGSEIVKSHRHCKKVQDPYSFRCIPHVHGACRDTMTFSGNIINDEINSVSDNPLVFANGEVISSGHFHGESVAQAMDLLAIAMSEFGAISERRTHYLMKGADGTLPPFMAKIPGLETGYMIAHVSASALASENKTLSHPASVDSLPTSGGQEDLVSMAPWAGQKTLQIQNNLATILAVELIVALTAIQEIHTKLKPAKSTQAVLDLLKDSINIHKGDRPLNKEIEAVKTAIINGELLSAIQPFHTLESF